MKTSCLQENLHRALAIVSRAVAGKSTLPVLANVLIQAGDVGGLELSATNLEIGIRCRVGAKTATPGAITVPGKLLADLVAQLPPERVDLAVDEGTYTLNIRCARFEQNIKGIDPEEFPHIARLPGTPAIRLDPATLCGMIEQVAFAAASDESRPVLTGVLVQLTESELIMAAADGFRLSVKRTNGLNGIEPAEVIIPARTLHELGRVAKDAEGEVSVWPLNKQIIFGLPDVEIVSQIIEGNFPDYNQIIPKSYTSRAVMDTGALLKAVKLAHLFARDAANVLRVEVMPGDSELLGGRVQVSATSAEQGDGVAEVDAAVEGPGGAVAFNSVYLRAALEVAGSPQVALETVGDEGWKHVIMPMHMEK